jgi:uncharacterized membrane protein YbaN (DUF454 family)
VKRALLLAAGWFFVGLGVLGAFLPLLPTTPFLLLALWAFARSSQRFHDWLYHHRLLGPPLRRWRDHRVVSLRAKVTSMTVMAATMLYTGLATPAPWYALLAMGALMAVGLAYILRCPSRPPSADE